MDAQDMVTRVLKRAAYSAAPRLALQLDERYWLSKQAKILQRSCESCRTPESLVDRVFACPSFRSAQNRTEIVRFVAIVQRLRPGRVMEIGTSRGGTLALLCHAAAPDARILALDIKFTAAQKRAYPHLGGPNQQVTCVAADSHGDAAFSRTTAWLQGRRLDCLLIDGDHSFAGVARDFEMYAPLVRPGGIVAFHDIVPDFRTRYGTATSAHVGEVPAFWSDVKTRFPEWTELIEDPDQDGRGIGILPWSGLVRS